MHISLAAEKQCKTLISQLLRVNVAEAWMVPTPLGTITVNEAEPPERVLLVVMIWPLAVTRNCTGVRLGMFVEVTVIIAGPALVKMTSGLLVSPPEGSRTATRRTAVMTRRPWEST